MRKPDGVSLAKVIPEADIEGEPKPKPKTKSVGALVAVGLLALGVILVVLFFTVWNNREKEPEPYFGDIATAEAMCENFVKEELKDSLNTTFAKKQSHQDTRTLVDYQVIGSVEAESDSGEVSGHSYKCVLTYLPETEEWVSDTFVSE